MRYPPAAWPGLFLHARHLLLPVSLGVVFTVFSLEAVVAHTLVQREHLAQVIEFILVLRCSCHQEVLSFFPEVIFYGKKSLINMEGGKASRLI